MSGQDQSNIASANGRKEAVRKAFNQEYLATQQAMSQAAQRARDQMLEQRDTIGNHVQSVKAGTTAAMPPIGHPAAQGAPHGNTAGTVPPRTDPLQMGAGMVPNGNQQIMIDIANEIRNIIAQEIDVRMKILSEKVETALAEAFPARESETTGKAEEQKPRRGARNTGRSASARKKT